MSRQKNNPSWNIQIRVFGEQLYWLQTRNLKSNVNQVWLNILGPTVISFACKLKSMNMLVKNKSGTWKLIMYLAQSTKRCSSQHLSYPINEQCFTDQWSMNVPTITYGCITVLQIILVVSTNNYFKKNLFQITVLLFNYCKHCAYF